MKLNSYLLKSVALTLVLTFSVTSTIAYGDSSVIAESFKNNFTTVGVHRLANQHGGILDLDLPTIARGTVKLNTQPRSELRAVELARDPREVLGLLFRNSGVDFSSAQLRRTEKGVHLQTRLDSINATVEKFPIPHDQPVTMVDLGHGQGAYALMLAHRYPNLKITGIEYDPDLYADSLRLLSVAEERGIIKKGQVEFLRGDFNDTRWTALLQQADIVYYYSYGTANRARLASTIKRNLKAGGKLVNYGVEHELMPYFSSPDFSRVTVKIHPDSSSSFQVYTKISQSSELRAFKILKLIQLFSLIGLASVGCSQFSTQPGQKEPKLKIPATENLEAAQKPLEDVLSEKRIEFERIKREVEENLRELFELDGLKARKKYYFKVTGGEVSKLVQRIVAGQIMINFYNAYQSGNFAIIDRIEHLLAYDSKFSLYEVSPDILFATFSEALELQSGSSTPNPHLQKFKIKLLNLLDYLYQTRHHDWRAVSVMAIAAGDSDPVVRRTAADYVSDILLESPVIPDEFAASAEPRSELHLSPTAPRSELRVTGDVIHAESRLKNGSPDAKRKHLLKIGMKAIPFLFYGIAAMSGSLILMLLFPKTYPLAAHFLSSIKQALMQLSLSRFGFPISIFITWLLANVVLLSFNFTYADFVQKFILPLLINVLRYPSEKQFWDRAGELKISERTIGTWMIESSKPIELFQKFKKAGLLGKNIGYHRRVFSDFATPIWRKAASETMAQFQDSPIAERFGFSGKMVKIGGRTFHVIGIVHGSEFMLLNKKKVRELSYFLAREGIPFFHERNFRLLYKLQVGSEIFDHGDSLRDSLIAAFFAPWFLVVSLILLFTKWLKSIESHQLFAPDYLTHPNDKAKDRGSFMAETAYLGSRKDSNEVVLLAGLGHLTSAVGTFYLHSKGKANAVSSNHPTGEIPTSASQSNDIDKARSELRLKETNALSLPAAKKPDLSEAAGRITALVLWVLTLPLVYLLAFIRKIITSGPMFFIQERIGFQGKTIVIRKIKTMKLDFNISDESITPYEWFLRRTGLDELPQLLSIVRGDMQWFGPRPRLPLEVDQNYIESVLHHTKPGFLSSSALKRGIGTGKFGMDTHDIELELNDIRDRSALYNTALVFKTIGVLTRNAFSGNGKSKNPKAASELRENSDLTIAEIDERMEKDGFPELKFLWKKFKSLKIDLNKINEEKLERARIAHARTALIQNPWLHLLAVSFTGVIGYFYASVQRAALTIFYSAISFWMDGNLASLNIREMINNSDPAGWIESLFVASGFTALVYILAVFAKRMFIFSWKTISALDLASMLKRRSYRQWFDQTEAAIQTMERLKSVGINENWDNPDYKVYYQIRGDNIEKVPAGEFEDAENQTIPEFIQKILRDFLGSTEDRQFKPGQYTPNLKEGKKSVTQFFNAHKEELARNKRGELPVEEGKKLLQELGQYVNPNAAKANQYLQKSISKIDDWGNLPDSIVEARIWRRDPWFDLTNQKDFFSSASLRGNTWLDKLNRRTKGALGPFNYLHNKSISAIDFRTREGRRVRARIAAAIYKDQDGKEQPILFVDGVEGRIFDAKAKGIQKIIENYARACGFKSVLYFAYPLNQGPKRLVDYVKKSGKQPELVSIEYADPSQKQYLDVYGYPVEPLEYAFPKGEVIGYVTDLIQPSNRVKIFPTQYKTWWFKFRKQYFLKAITASLVLVVTGPVAWLTDNASLIPPLLLLFGGMWWFQHKSERRAIAKKTDEQRSELRAYPKFIETILAEINENPVAQKMSYPPRAIAKLEKLLEYFPSPNRNLRYFFEEILYNVSVKDGDLVNVLKFLDKLSPDQRKKTEEVIAVVWSASNQEAMRRLSEDKAVRDSLKKDAFDKLMAVQKFMKATRLSRMKISEIAKVRRALGISIADALDIVTMNPRILKGLRKPPRPIYAWVAPTAFAFLVGFGVFTIYPLISNAALFFILMGIIAPGTFLISTRLNIAPGILYYKRLRDYLSERLRKTGHVSAIEKKMQAIGINVSEFEKGRVYENKEKGIRIRIHDKKTLKGAIDFLTSSEAIGNCISLQHFVSWILPSLLSDDGIILADIDHKGSGDAYQHRAQMWMIASEDNGDPVLTVNSFEFNNDGAKYFDELMPEAIQILQDVARRSGFKKIYAGITNYGRDYLDQHYSQGASRNTIKKIHDPEAGFQYHFDAFRYRWLARDFVLKKSRSFTERAYAIIFGLFELTKGNRAKARAFFDSARNARNFWEIPLQGQTAAPQSELLRSELRNQTAQAVNTDPVQTLHALIISKLSVKNIKRFFTVDVLKEFLETQNLNAQGIIKALRGKITLNTSQANQILNLIREFRLLNPDSPSFDVVEWFWVSYWPKLKYLVEKASLNDLNRLEAVETFNQVLRPLSPDFDAAFSFGHKDLISIYDIGKIGTKIADDILIPRGLIVDIVNGSGLLVGKIIKRESQRSAAGRFVPVYTVRLKSRDGKSDSYLSAFAKDRHIVIIEGTDVPSIENFDYYQNLKKLYETGQYQFPNFDQSPVAYLRDWIQMHFYSLGDYGYVAQLYRSGVLEEELSHSDAYVFANEFYKGENDYSTSLYWINVMKAILRPGSLLAHALGGYEGDQQGLLAHAYFEVEAKLNELIRSSYPAQILFPYLNPVLPVSDAMRAALDQEDPLYKVAFVQLLMLLSDEFFGEMTIEPKQWLDFLKKEITDLDRFNRKIREAAKRAYEKQFFTLEERRQILKNRSELRQTAAVTQRSKVDQVMDVIRDLMDQAGSPNKIYDSLTEGDILEALTFLLSPHDSNRFWPRSGSEDRRIYWSKVLPEGFSNRELRELGVELRREWENRGLDKKFGNLNQFLATLIDPYFKDLDEFEKFAGRLDHLLAGGLEDLFYAYWTLGLTQVIHLRPTGLHIEEFDGKEIKKPSDNELLADYVKRFISVVSAWPEERLADIPPSTRKFSQSYPGFTYRNLMLWALSVMLDQDVHDWKFGYRSTDLGVKIFSLKYGARFWPDDTKRRTGKQSMTEYLSRMLTDVPELDQNGVETGRKISNEKIEKLVAEVLSRNESDWVRLGFRSPWDVSEVQASMLIRTIGDRSKNPLRDAVLTLPLPNLQDPELNVGINTSAPVYLKYAPLPRHLIFPTQAAFIHRRKEAVRRRLFFGEPFRTLFPNLKTLTAQKRSELRSDGRTNPMSYKEFEKALRDYQTLMKLSFGRGGKHLSFEQNQAVGARKEAIIDLLKKNSKEHLQNLIREFILKADLPLDKKQSYLWYVSSAMSPDRYRMTDAFFKEHLIPIYLSKTNSPEENRIFLELAAAYFNEHYIKADIHHDLEATFRQASPDDLGKLIHLLLHLRTIGHEFFRELISILLSVSPADPLAAAFVAAQGLVRDIPSEGRKRIEYPQMSLYLLHQPNARAAYFYLMKVIEAERKGGVSTDNSQDRIISYSRRLDNNASYPGEFGRGWFSHFRDGIHRNLNRSDFENTRRVLAYWLTLDESILKESNWTLLRDDMTKDFNPATLQTYSKLLNRFVKALAAKGKISKSDPEAFLDEILDIPEREVVAIYEEANRDEDVSEIDYERVQLMTQLYLAFADHFGTRVATIVPFLKGETEDLRDGGYLKKKMTAITRFMREDYDRLLMLIDSDDHAAIFSAIVKVQNDLKEFLLSGEENQKKVLGQAEKSIGRDGEDSADEDADDIDQEWNDMHEEGDYLYDLRTLVEMSEKLSILASEKIAHVQEKIEKINSVDDLRRELPNLIALGRFIQASGLGGVDFDQLMVELDSGSIKASQLYDLVHTLEAEVHKITRQLNNTMRAAMQYSLDEVGYHDLAKLWREHTSLFKIKTKTEDDQTYQIYDFPPEGKERLEAAVIDELIRNSGATAFDRALMKFDAVLASALSQGQDEAIREDAGAERPDDFEQHLYRFGENETDERPELLSLWSKKGLNLIRMTHERIPVPPGVILSAKLVTKPDIFRSDEFRQKIAAEIERLKRYSEYPDLKLILYARSGSAFMLPGLLATVSNVGMNDAEAEALAQKSGDAWFAYDTYAEFIRSFSINVLGIPEAEFEQVLNVKEKEDLSADGMKAVVEQCKAIVARHGKIIPNDMMDQVMMAVEAVYASWDSEEARAYRTRHQISQEWGTVVILQKGVFGNLKPTDDGKISGAGHAVLRTLPDGHDVLQGKFRFHSIGDQLMSRAGQNYILIGNGERIRPDEQTFEALQPELYAQVFEYARKLKNIFRYNQQFEFTIERGKIWIVQSNDDFVTDQYPEFADSTDNQPIARGHGVSGGAIRGLAANSIEAAEKLLGELVSHPRADVDGVILILDRVNPEMINRIPKGVHILAKTISVHAETLAQKEGISAVYGVPDMVFQPEKHLWLIAGRDIADGDVISMDGHENPLLYHQSGNVYLGSVAIKSRAIRSELRNSEAESAAPKTMLLDAGHDAIRAALQDSDLSFKQLKKLLYLTNRILQAEPWCIHFRELAIPFLTGLLGNKSRAERFADHFSFHQLESAKDALSALGLPDEVILILQELQESPSAPADHENVSSKGARAELRQIVLGYLQGSSAHIRTDVLHGLNSETDWRLARKLYGQLNHFLESHRAGIAIAPLFKMLNAQVFIARSIVRRNGDHLGGVTYHSLHPVLSNVKSIFLSLYAGDHPISYDGPVSDEFLKVRDKDFTYLERLLTHELAETLVEHNQYALPINFERLEHFANKNLPLSIVNIPHDKTAVYQIAKRIYETRLQALERQFGKKKQVLDYSQEEIETQFLSRYSIVSAREFFFEAQSLYWLDPDFVRKHDPVMFQFLSALVYWENGKLVVPTSAIQPDLLMKARVELRKNVSETLQQMGFWVNQSTGQLFYKEPYFPPALDLDLYVIRHGETHIIAEGLRTGRKRFQGSGMDNEGAQLTPKGRVQAQADAEKLFEKFKDQITANPDQFVVIINPLGRVRDTAEPFIRLVREKLGIELKVMIDPDTKEIFQGEWEGLTNEQIKAQFGREQFKAARSYQKWSVLAKPEHGESFAHLIIRAAAFWKRMNEQYRGKTVILFNHAAFSGALQVLKKDMRVVHPEGHIDWRRAGLKTGEITHFTDDYFRAQRAEVLRRDEAHQVHGVRGKNISNEVGTRPTHVYRRWEGWIPVPPKSEQPPREKSGVRSELRNDLENEEPIELPFAVDQSHHSTDLARLEVELHNAELAGDLDTIEEVTARIQAVRAARRGPFQSFPRPPKHRSELRNYTVIGISAGAIGIGVGALLYYSLIKPRRIALDEQQLRIKILLSRTEVLLNRFSSFILSVSDRGNSLAAEANDYYLRILPELRKAKSALKGMKEEHGLLLKEEEEWLAQTSQAIDSYEAFLDHQINEYKKSVTPTDRNMSELREGESNSIEINVTVKNRQGVHASPAMFIVEMAQAALAKNVSVKIKNLNKGSAEWIEADNPMALMTLEAVKDTRLAFQFEFKTDEERISAERFAVAFHELVEVRLFGEDGGELGGSEAFVDEMFKISETELAERFQKLTEPMPGPDAGSQKSELRSVQKLLRNLSHPNFTIRKTRADELGKGNEVGLETLLQYLAEPVIPVDEWKPLIEVAPKNFNPDMLRQSARFAALYVLNWWIERDTGFYIPVLKAVLNQEKSSWTAQSETDINRIYEQNSSNPLGANQPLSLIQIMKLFRRWYSELQMKNRSLTLSENERRSFRHAKYIHRAVRILEEIADREVPVIDAQFYEQAGVKSLTSEHRNFTIAQKTIGSRYDVSIHLEGEINKELLPESLQKIKPIDFQSAIEKSILNQADAFNNTEIGDKVQSEVLGLPLIMAKVQSEVSGETVFNFRVIAKTEKTIAKGRVEVKENPLFRDLQTEIAPVARSEMRRIVSNARSFDNQIVTALQNRSEMREGKVFTRNAFFGEKGSLAVVGRNLSDVYGSYMVIVTNRAELRVIDEINATIANPKNRIVPVEDYHKARAELRNLGLSMAIIGVSDDAVAVPFLEKIADKVIIWNQAFVDHVLSAAAYLVGKFRAQMQVFYSA